jgi:hypothetical protein
MTYNVVDLRTNKVLGSYETAEQAVRAESHLVHEPGDQVKHGMQLKHP